MTSHFTCGKLESSICDSSFLFKIVYTMNGFHVGHFRKTCFSHFPRSDYYLHIDLQFWYIFIIKIFWNCIFNSDLCVLMIILWRRLELDPTLMLLVFNCWQTHSQAIRRWYHNEILSSDQSSWFFLAGLFPISTFLISSQCFDQLVIVSLGSLSSWRLMYNSRHCL